MVIHFELHPSWTQSLLFGDAIKAGVSLGKDNHWHYNGITGLYVVSNGLKLTYFYLSSELRGGWGYASYDWFTNTYLPGVTRYMQFPIPNPFAFNGGNPIDGSPFFTWPPAVVQSGTVAIDLFKMAGTPNTAGVQYSYGFANYTMEPTAIP
jgi:hypothetical protein